VLKVLEPVWPTRTQTASKLRSRIELVLDWAKVRGYCQGENPARWRGHLDKLLPAPSKVRKVKHHPALPYADLPAFMTVLRGQEGIAARALEFTVLTAARSGEVLGVTWDEVDFSAKVWTVPPARMKGNREHRVPLSDRALAILSMVEPADATGSDFIFAGEKRVRPIRARAMWDVLQRMKRSLTVHGFRSTFRDWAAEQTHFPGEAVEMALAHAVGNKVEAAYRRGDMYERRRELMDAWAAYCDTGA
jgi:integrase